MTKYIAKTNEGAHFPDCCDLLALQSLSMRKGLGVVAKNEHILVWSAALHFAQAGADLAITYVTEGTRPHVTALTECVDTSNFIPCDVAKLGALEAVSEAITVRWGKLDFLLQTVGSMRPKDLCGWLTDYSAERVAQAMLISENALIRMAQLAEPLMPGGRNLIILSCLCRQPNAPKIGKFQRHFLFWQFCPQHRFAGQ